MSETTSSKNNQIGNIDPAEVFFPYLDVSMPNMNSCADIIAAFLKEEGLYGPECGIIKKNPKTNAEGSAYTEDAFMLDEMEAISGGKKTASQEELTGMLLSAAYDPKFGYFHFFAGLEPKDLRRFVAVEIPAECKDMLPIALPYVPKDHKYVMHFEVDISSGKRKDGSQFAINPIRTKELELKLKSMVLDKVREAGGTILRVNTIPYVTLKK